MLNAFADKNNFFTGKLLCLWFLIAFVFFLAEVGMRYRAIQRFGKTKSTMIVDDPVEGRYLIPNFVSKGSLRTITINEHGFRGTSFPLEPVPGTVRIACLGSSTVFSGMTNSDGDTFPAVLEKDLNNDFKGKPSVEVINAGIPGMSTEDIQQHLERRIIRIKPQIALFYPPPNDLGSIIRGSGTGTAKNVHFLRVWRRDHSVFYNAFLDKVKTFSPKVAAAQFRHFPKDGKEQLVEKYTELVNRCRKYQIKPVFLLHTFMVRKEQNTAEQQRNLTGDFWGLGSIGALEAIEAQQSATRQVAEQENIPLIDTEFCVPAKKEFFEDVLHLTPKGNALLARTIADDLENQNFIIKP
jgi:lysophospholipase L1-like esterase